MRNSLQNIWILTFWICVGSVGSAFSSKAHLDFRQPLGNTSWRLVEFQSMDDSIGIIRPETAALYVLRLNDDGSFSLRLKCHDARGQWSRETRDEGTRGRFEFHQIAMTPAICSPPRMDQDLAAQAKYIRSYLVRDGRLYLSLMADGGIYVWEPYNENAFTSKPSASPEDGGPLNWLVSDISSVLNLRQQPSTSSKIVSTFPRGTLLDNLGCQVADRRTWCYVQQFGGGPVGYVAAEFLKPAVSPNGAVVRGPDNSSYRAGQGDFDATGQIPCALSPGQPMRQCAFGVARAGGGYATVVIEKPDGAKRAVFFRMGMPVGVDTSEADGYPEFKAGKKHDLHLIRIGDERYEIPDAVILGG